MFCFLCFGSFLVFFFGFGPGSGSFDRLLRLETNKKHVTKTQKTTQSFKTLRIQCLLPGHSSHDLFYSNSSLLFGSGTLHRLLGLQKTKNARGKPTRPFKEKIRNVLGQDFLQRLCFFCFFVLLLFFVWTRKPPSATRTRTAKNTGTPEEHQKNQKFSKCLCPGLSFLLCLFFWFQIFSFGS